MKAKEIANQEFTILASHCSVLDDFRLRRRRTPFAQPFWRFLAEHIQLLAQRKISASSQAFDRKNHNDRGPDQFEKIEHRRGSSPDSNPTSPGVHDRHNTEKKLDE
jgi:hypothetical protein